MGKSKVLMSVMLSGWKKFLLMDNDSCQPIVFPPLKCLAMQQVVMVKLKVMLLLRTEEQTVKLSKMSRDQVEMSSLLVLTDQKWESAEVDQGSCILGHQLVIELSNKEYLRMPKSI